MLRARNVPLLILAIVLIPTSFAFAIPFTFTASGTAQSDGRPENAKAIIDFQSSMQMTITLENTSGIVGGISSVLDGFGFTFSTAPSSIMLSSVAASGGIIYDGSNFVPYTSGSSPYGWGVTGSTTPLLAAGNGSFKPWGIVNSNYDTTDGMPNAQHNPYLLGPVTFTLTLNGLTEIPNITGTTFYFGTSGDTQSGIPAPVPEPATVLLLGSGLLGLAGYGRKKFFKK